MLTEVILMCINILPFDRLNSTLTMLNFAFSSLKLDAFEIAD